MKIFRMKIVAKRQVTIPTELLKSLRIREGDYLEVQAEDGKKVLKLRGLTLAPTSYFSKDVLRKLHNRAAEIEGAGYPEVQDVSELPTKRVGKEERTKTAGHGV